MNTGCKEEGLCKQQEIKDIKERWKTKDKEGTTAQKFPQLRLRADDDSAFIENHLLKAVHDKMSTFETNLRKESLSVPAYTLTNTLSGIRPIKLATMDGKSFLILTSNRKYDVLGLRLSVDSQLRFCDRKRGWAQGVRSRIILQLCAVEEPSSERLSCQFSILAARSKDTDDFVSNEEHPRIGNRFITHQVAMRFFANELPNDAITVPMKCEEILFPQLAYSSKNSDYPSCYHSISREKLFDTEETENVSQKQHW
ncbi:hypothetical protein PR048_024910 [Dryococelus australis]|uniref:Uncharacterized protein n=1 Tax=Dryococelus australis TaxID=614101 RepID=A0ABQ9GPW5_9NEOP|nr:hypothetical protein PR048_024910 [Dryococelus australis]